MTVTKNEERGYWEVFFYYKDYTGKRKQKHKRGFKTRKEAITWAEQFIVQQSHNLDMTFQSFWELYRDDMSQRLRACLKNHFCDLHAPLCGIFAPNSVNVAPLRLPHSVQISHKV